MALYDSPLARLRVNRILSDPIYIHNRTRQGCPLLSYLYILAMEHRTNAIRSNPPIQGLIIDQREIQLSLYADDILLYSTNPNMVFPALIHKLKIFGQHSNFRANMHKMEGLSQCCGTLSVLFGKLKLLNI